MEDAYYIRDISGAIVATVSVCCGMEHQHARLLAVAPDLARTLTNLVNDPPAGDVSYADVRERLLSAGATAVRLTAFEAECLHAPVASGCLSKISQANGTHPPLPP